MSHAKKKHFVLHMTALVSQVPASKQAGRYEPPAWGDADTASIWDQCNRESSCWGVVCWRRNAPVRCLHSSP